jgi:hypothetical protein
MTNETDWTTIHKLGSNESVRNEENDDTLIWQFKNELQITIHSTSQYSIKPSVNKYSIWFTQSNTVFRVPEASVGLGTT